MGPLVLEVKPSELWAECREMLASQTGKAAPNDRQLLNQVVGAGGTMEGYLYERV